MSHHYQPYTPNLDPGDMMQQLSIHDETPDSPYHFQQQFIPFAGPFSSPNPNHYYYQTPYSTPFQSSSSFPSDPSHVYPPPPGTVWHSPPSSPQMGAPPNLYNQPHRPPYPGHQSMSGPPRNSSFNRTSWKGPSGKPSPQVERKSYHPQPPANRSDWVMWVGNVPPNTTHEELWKYFNCPLPGHTPWRGPSSIFLISRSSCAFVNLASEAELERAVAFFNGRSLRPWDPRCPRLVCRIRKRDDDLRSGVGAQRGTGMHRDWVKRNATPPPEVPTPPTELPDIHLEGQSHRKSSASYASTNSSFLARHFPMRVFILKSTAISELEQSVQDGTWQTQRHNEPVLDQAFRTSQEVFLIFGANKSGEFFGYAKMVEHIDKDKAKKWSSASKGSSKFGQIPEEENRQRGGSEPIRPTYFLTPSQSHVTATSPGELSPSEEFNFAADTRSNTDPTKIKSPQETGARAQTMSAYFPIPQQSGDQEADRQVARGSSNRNAEETKDGVLRKDTMVTPGEGSNAPDAPGTSFKIQWIKVGRLPFHQTKHLRNPWNADREVKVSRDGTEVEPGIGSQLMALWA